MKMKMEFVWIAVAIVIFAALIYGIVHYKKRILISLTQIKIEKILT